VILTPLSTKARAQGTCESLKSFTAPHTTITSVLLHPGGKYVSTDGFNLTFADLPPSCQVTASIKPSQDADIKVQIWLPMRRYNGRYLGTGNAGYAGNILDSELAQGINNGFATASTDLGTCLRCALTEKTKDIHRVRADAAEVIEGGGRVGVELDHARHVRSGGRGVNANT
jgi:hypothetical protein